MSSGIIGANKRVKAKPLLLFTIQFIFFCLLLTGNQCIILHQLLVNLLSYFSDDGIIIFNQEVRSLTPNEFEVQKKNAIKEFKYIISKYILPLFDTSSSLKYVCSTEYNKELVTIEDGDEISTVHFYPFISEEGQPTDFHYSIETYSSNSLKKRVESILRELLKVSEYNCKKYSRQRYYGIGDAREKAYKNRTLDLAFELGMCKWLTNNDKETAILHELISKMIDWSSRTYEGKKVPFGIVIDFKKHSIDNAADYLHFLDNDSSAVFTDGIFSGILLDDEGKVLSFLTNESTAGIAIDSSKEIFVPYQFISIAKLCYDSAIGIIALTNGEIIIVKNHSICFAKRGQKWVAFDWARVQSNLRPYFIYAGNTDEKEINKKIKTIFCTLLDVSFSHSGGCMALVLPEYIKKIGETVKERIDLFGLGQELDGISKESKEKIEILTYLLTYSNSHLRSFFEIEKPLRKEILSLDGATVLAMDGTFFCAGSIVAVGGGSSGGGRTAATKKLAEYGIAIKISEDGYIEAYGKDISGNQQGIIRLFSFK